MGTLYAVKCEITKTREYLGICGLFKDKDTAKAVCDFWNDGCLPSYDYYISEITTDLIGDNDDASNN